MKTSNDTKITKSYLEAELGALLIRGWHLDGAGPARFGWATPKPAGGVTWQGKSLAEVARRLGHDVEVTR